MPNKVYTPGPWFVDRLTEYRPDGEVILDAVVTRDVTICLMDTGDSAGLKDKEANARLIAAAPEMLEALKEFDIGARSLFNVIDPRVWEVLSMALDKARGLVDRLEEK